MFDFLSDWFEGVVDALTGAPGVDEATGSMVDGYLEGTYPSGDAASGVPSVGGEGVSGVSSSNAAFVDSLNQSMAETSDIASGEATPEEMEAFEQKNQAMTSMYGGAAASQEISNSVHEQELTAQTLDQAHEASVDAAQTEIQADSALSAAEDAVDDPL